MSDKSRTRTMLAILLTLAIALAVMWLALRSGDPRAPVSSEHETGPAATVHTPDGAENLAYADSAAIQARSSAPIAASSPVSGDGIARAVAPRAFATGRVVDEDGAPIGGARVQVTASSWAADAELPVSSDTEQSSSAPSSRETTTDASGAFVVDVPAPGASWVSLHIEADVYHAIADANWGVEAGSTRSPLHEGENALGDFVLATTGAVSGRVQSQSGAPIANAQIQAENYYPGGAYIGATSDEDGRFTLGHLTAGVFDLLAQSDGWMLARARGVDVRRGTTTKDIVLRMERAPSISGRVIDERGQPVADVDVWGWPEQGGAASTARSSRDGAFTLHLPQRAPYVLEVDSEGFERAVDEAAAYPPGTTNIEIVLHRVPRTTFLVLDAESGVPIERYGIGVVDRPSDAEENWIGDSSGWTDASPRRVEAHPRGECTIPADPTRHRVQCESPGFAPLVVDVVHDNGSVARQTLRMKRGGSITGRVTFAGQPVLRPTIRLERFGVPIERTLEADVAFEGNERFDLDEYSGRLRVLSGAVDGSFRIDDLAAGTYRITVQGGGAAAKSVGSIAVALGETSDIGELALDAGGRIQGRVVLAAGISPIGLQLSIDEWTHARIDDARGTFVFEGVTPGPHTLMLERSPPVVLEEELVDVDVVEGRTNDIVIDLSARAACRVRARVVRAGAPVAGLSVFWLLSKDGEPYREGSLGTTDDDGIATGDVEGGAAISLRVLASAEGFPVGATPPTPLLNGALYEPTIRIETGELVIVFPDSLELPAQGAFQVTLQRRGDTSGQVDSVYWFTPSSGADVEHSKWTDRRCALGPVAPGEYDCWIHATRTDEESDSMLLPPMHTTVTIRTNETTVIDVNAE